MTRGLADTSVFVARESGRPLAVDRLPTELEVSVAAGDVETRHRRLATLTQALTLSPVPVDEAVADAWARLRIVLRDAGARMPLNDSWIAATALALGVPVVTQDDDYARVAGLDVIRV